MQQFPSYSDSLIQLVRFLSRAELAVRTSSWSYSSLRDDEDIYVEGDGCLYDWACFRLMLLGDQLELARSAINQMIILESASHFKCEIDNKGNVNLPEGVIKSIFPPDMGYAFSYTTIEDAQIKSEQYLSDNYLIFFDNDAHVLPRTIPKEFIEIWWPRLLFGFDGRNYHMALSEFPGYGWNCYGHEM